MAFDLRSLPNVQTRPVRCTVESNPIGRAVVRAYNYNNVRDRPGKRCYSVPLYPMVLRGEGEAETYSYKVLRFGVVVGERRDYLYAAPASEHQLIWQDGYMDGKGAWRLSKTSNVLIHDGADFPRSNAWGAAGCIEVAGRVNKIDAWRVFNQRVRELSNVPADWPKLNAHKLIQKNRSFTCILKPVAKPPLKPLRCP